MGMRSMRRALVGMLALALLVPAAPASAQLPSVLATTPVAVASGLDFPAAMTFAPDGRIFYGERFTGEIRIKNLNTGADRLFFTLPAVATAGEQGVLGLAVAPGFPSTPYVYAYYTRTVNGAPQNQIVRITSESGRGTSMTVLVRIAAATIHNGGIIAFGPDGLLYAGVGEVGVPANAQNTRILTGKVLRMTAGGRGAAGNPFGNRVFSYGHRNLFGLAFDPRGGRLWATENGPSCNDEINRPLLGGNFAWGPSQSCGAPPDAEDTNRDGPAPRHFPQWLYNPVNAPTGAAFCEGCGLGTDTEGTLLFGAWNDGAIRRLTLTSDRLGVASSSILYDHVQGILAMARHPNTGRIYFSDPDQIFRLDP